MTNKHDFKGLLELPKGIWKDRTFNDDEVQTIKTALRLADRLQSGYVSEGMVQSAYDNHALKYDDTFKPMAQQMIKEVGDEKTNY